MLSWEMLLLIRAREDHGLESQVLHDVFRKLTEMEEGE